MSGKGSEKKALRSTARKPYLLRRLQYLQTHGSPAVAAKAATQLAKLRKRQSAAAEAAAEAAVPRTVRRSSKVAVSAPAFTDDRDRLLNTEDIDDYQPYETSGLDAEYAEEDSEAAAAVDAAADYEQAASEEGMPVDHAVDAAVAGAEDAVDAAPVSPHRSLSPGSAAGRVPRTVARLAPAIRALLLRACNGELLDPAEEQCVDTLLAYPEEDDSVYFDVVNQYLEEVESLRDLHAKGKLTTASYRLAVVPISDNAMRLLRDVAGELPTSIKAHPDRAYNLELLGRVVRVNPEQQQGLGPLRLFTRVVQPGGTPEPLTSTPALDNVGYTSAIGVVLPRTLAIPSGTGLDPATTGKTSLLKPPKFWEGLDSDEPIRSWLTAAAHWLSMNRVPRTEAVGVAANYLRGKAQSYWFSMVDTIRTSGKDPTDWDVFKDTMVLAYGALDPEFIARTKIAALRQTGSLESYVRELQMLFAELVHQPMTEADKVFRFFDGMNSGLAMRVQVDPATGDRWQTFAAAAGFAIKQDILYQANRMQHKKQNGGSDRDRAGTGGVKKGSMKRKGQKPTGQRPGPAGGAGARGRNGGGGTGTSGGSGGSGGAGSSRGGPAPTKAQRQEWFKDGKCLNCGHPDHRKNDCPHRRST
jgi:uncharacterized membrane protein YgcG